MNGGWVRARRAGVLATFALASIALQRPIRGASKAVDLDGNAANGAESQVDLNVLQTFPVQIETKVTNRAVGDSFTFAWPSAGPGGFTSSVTPGSAGGVGAIWTWTTNQSVVAFSGSTCDKDVCFASTGGPDQTSGFCSLACLADATTLSVAKGVGGTVVLNWAGGTAGYTVYRAVRSVGVVDTPNAIGTSPTALTYTDTPPVNDAIDFYVIRGTDCSRKKACTVAADCSAPGDGSCYTRGPFGVPGRSLVTGDVTVSAASLTASLITFFSPPKEIFRATSTAGSGGVSQTVSNSGTAPMTINIPEYPPGCCPTNPNVAHQLRCGDSCVDYLNDSQNCGACGNVCGDGTCCAQGSCLSVCPEGTAWCNGECIDIRNDSNNCGGCGITCGEGSCCNEGACVSVCGPGEVYCDGQCVDPQNDSSSCGACGNACGGGTCCNAGACVSECGDGLTYCDGTCFDLQNDSNNCGSCGNVCDYYSFCSGGSCQSGEPLLGGNPGVPPACPNPNPSHPHDPICPDANPSPGPIAGSCPVVDPPEEFGDAPICIINASTQTIPPGTSGTICNAAGTLYKEVPTTITVCGDGIPGVLGTCNNSSTKITTGTFNRLVPDPTKTLGNAYVTPFAVHIVNDTSGDGLLQPGESGQILVDVVNAGPMDITHANGSLSALPVDLSDDGIVNPVGLTLGTGSSSYGTIPGTPPAANCVQPPPQPATNSPAFPVTVPGTHPGDSSHPIVLSVGGTVNGSPFAMDVPLSLGIAHKCDPTLHARDYDSLSGLSNPMAKLVPLGDPVPFPSKAFSAGTTRPLKLQVGCGSVNLDDSMVDPPQIVGLSEATRGELDINLLSLNSDDPANPNDPFFRFNNFDALSGGHWMFNMRTSLLGTGTFTVRIKIAGRKVYAAGFVLQ